METMQAGARAQRPQPQTTGEPPSGHFTRHSRRSARPGYSVNSAFGQSIDQPLSAAPGYLRYLDLVLNANGGGNATTNSVAAQTTGVATDFGLATASVGTNAITVPGGSPAAAISFVQVKDAYGTVVFSGPGYEMLHLVPLFSGQVGVLGAANLMKWPNTATAGIATGTATTTTGNFFLHSRIPFEITPGYGCLAIGNATLQPSLHIQYNASSAIYSTAPGTLPTLATTVDENYWAVPTDAPGLEPPGLGTTLQWIALTATPTVGSASGGTRIAIGRTGGYITTIILVARDTASNRQAAVWPALGSNNRIRLYLDGVPVLDEMIEERYDKMYEDFGGANGSANIDNVGAFPAGVLAYSLKTSESQANLGQLDSLDVSLSTTPGTLIEVECTPWGTFSSGPAQITAVVGAIVPRGGIRQGVDVN